MDSLGGWCLSNGKSTYKVCVPTLVFRCYSFHIWIGKIAMDVDTKIYFLYYYFSVTDSNIAIIGYSRKICILYLTE